MSCRERVQTPSPLCQTLLDGLLVLLGQLLHFPKISVYQLYLTLVPCRYEFAFIVSIIILCFLPRFFLQMFVVTFSLLHLTNVTWIVLWCLLCTFQLSSPSRKMRSSKLHKFIQVSGFQVQASPLQSSLIQGNTPKDASSNCLLMMPYVLPHNFCTLLFVW